MDAKLLSLIDAYAAAPGRIESAVCGLTRTQLLTRPVPGKWSTLEVVAHLADTEQVYCDRMKRVIATSRPLIIGFSETDYVEHLAYHERDLAEELAVININRAQMTRILRLVPDGAFDRDGVHNKAGIITLRNLIQDMIDHVEHHCSFIDAKRKAMGLSP